LVGIFERKILPDFKKIIKMNFSEEMEMNGSFAVIKWQPKMSWYFLHFAYAYIMPVTCSICLLFNVINLVVFNCGGKDMKEKHFIYFKAKTFAETSTIIIGGLMPLAKYQNGSSLFVNIYQSYLATYILEVAFAFLGFLEVLIVHDRYITLKANSRFNFHFKNNWTVVTICLAISAVTNVPYLFQLRIVPLEANSSLFISIWTEFAGSRFNHYYFLVKTVIINSINCLLLPVASGMLIVEFRKFLKRKQALTSNNTMMTNAEFNAKKNLTSLVLIFTAVFLLSRLIPVIAMAYAFYENILQIELDFFNYANFFAFDFNYSFTAGLSFFIYFKFNRAFRMSLFSLIKKICPCCQRRLP
jgi:hypothetical protein